MENRSALAGNLRRASAADIGALAEVCRESFPTSLRWQAAPSVARRWWQGVLATSAVETHVFESGGVVTGFSVLVTDLDLWAKQTDERKTPVVSAILSVLMHPRIVAAKMLKRFAAESPPGDMQATAIPCEWPRARTWIELVAVNPAMRGHGVGKMLLNACETRTVELGGAVIGLSVDGDNNAAIRLYEAAGYVSAPAVGSRRVYLKNLVSQSVPGVGISEDMHSAPSDGRGQA